MKTQLRKKYIAIRKAIEDKAERSALICSSLFSLSEYKNAGYIAIYKALPSEVSTDNIITTALSQGKIVALPKTVGSKMTFYKIGQNEPLIKSPFGVLEPEENEENLLSPQDFDLIIVPGVAFDRNKNRLGYGKGCYDRFLPETRGVIIALCFDGQLAESNELITHEFDIKMQKLITESEII